MFGKTGKQDRTAEDRSRRILSPRAIVTLAGALVVILGLVVGLNVGGLREELMWRISPPLIDSLAVLPFANLSHDPAQDYLADGMISGLNNYLGQIGTFRVIARTSVLRYKKAPKPLPEFARELDIDAVVEGGVLRSGDRVRISTNLIHAPTNRRLWRQTYERDLRDILNLQAEISRAIALQIKARLTPQQEARLTASRNTANPQAYEAYVQGVLAGNLAKMEACFKRAIQLDPAYAQAYDYLGTVYWAMNMFPSFPPRNTHPKAKETSQRALSLNPLHPLAGQSHRTLASVALEYEWDFIEAEKQFKRALELAPSGPVAHHYYAHFLLSMGRMEEAREEGRRAMELDPLNPTLFACMSWHDIALRDYEAAEKRAMQALGLNAPDQLARLTLGWSYALRGRHEEAIVEFQKAVLGWKGAVFPTAVLGHGYAVAGNKDAAQEVLNGLLERSKSKREYVSPYEIAMVYAGLGDSDRAFEWLEKAFQDRATLLVYFRMDPRIWGLRSDPRHRELLRRMNFPQDRQD